MRDTRSKPFPGRDAELIEEQLKFTGMPRIATGIAPPTRTAQHELPSAKSHQVIVGTITASVIRSAAAVAARPALVR